MTVILQEEEDAMKRTLAYLCSLFLLTACNDAPPRSSVAPSIHAYALSGRVTAEGRPVAGAGVAHLNLGNGALTSSTLTDTNGSYRLSGVSQASEWLVSVSKTDYFTSTRYVQMLRDETTSDFALERASFISVSDQIQSRPDGARCASLGYGGNGGENCRRFALSVPASGTLEVIVSSSPTSPFDGTILKPDGTIGTYGAVARTPLRLTLDVVAGLTYQIDVVPIGAPDFALTAAVR